MFENFITDEMDALFTKKNEYHKERAQLLEEHKQIDSIYKERTLYIKNNFAPVFERFKTFIEEKGIKCEFNSRQSRSFDAFDKSLVDDELSSGINSMSISIPCIDDGLSIKPKFHFNYCHANSTAIVGGNAHPDDYELIDEIEFICESGVDIIKCEEEFIKIKNTWLAVEKYYNSAFDYENKHHAAQKSLILEKKQYKFDDVNDNIILQELFNWFNALVKNDLIK
ncbi:MAG: hypothetical protein FWB77_01545 [Treponema sp.]|nr:hypothetical protein [Treponema sp.]